MAKGPRRLHSPLSGGAAAEVADAREIIEEMVGVGTSTPTLRKEVAIAAAEVGVAF